MFKQLDWLGRFFYLGTVIPLFLALITPLLVNSSFLFPFITTKALYFRVLIEIALVFYIVLFVYARAYAPRLTRLTWMVTIFFVIAILASVVGIDPYRSFWGNIERGEGLLTLLHVFTFFFISIHVLRSREIWKWVIHGVIVVSVIASVYALFQRFDADFVIAGGASRLTSTIGNAAFFAGYLLFGIFFTIWQLIKTKMVWARVLYGLAALFQFYIFINTETRGAFIGLILSLIVITVVYMVFGSKKQKRFSGIGLVSLAVFVGLVWMLRSTPVVKNVGILRRLTSISFEDVTTQSRLLTWDSSFQGWKERPVLGYGWENYNVAFNKYFHAEIFRDAGSQIWFDRAHNIIFDILVTTGIVGLIAYLAIFVSALLALYRYFRVTSDLGTASLLSGLLIAYFVQNIFVFDVLATYISFYVLLGLIVFLERTTHEQRSLDDLPVPASTARVSAPYHLSIVAGILVVLFVLAVYRFNVVPAQANQRSIDALTLAAMNKHAEASEAFKDAIALGTNQAPEVRQKYAEFALGLNRVSGGGDPFEAFKQSQFSSAIAEIKKNIEEHPFDVQNYLFLMILYNQSDQYNPNRLSLALDVGKQAIELSPTRPQIYFELGQVYMSQKKFSEGIDAFERALSLQPLAKESQWNLAAAYAIAGLDREAEELFDRMADEHNFDYYSLDNLRRMRIVYSTNENWDKLADIYERLVALEPGNVDWYAKLAVTYQQLGRFDDARRIVTKALDIDTSLEREAKIFLEQIDAAERGVGVQLPEPSPESELPESELIAE